MQKVNRRELIDMIKEWLVFHPDDNMTSLAKKMKLTNICNLDLFCKLDLPMSLVHSITIANFFKVEVIGAFKTEVKEEDEEGEYKSGSKRKKPIYQKHHRDRIEEHQAMLLLNDELMLAIN